jgi:LuxR family maltose regulon positive regulatory protein
MSTDTTILSKFTRPHLVHSYLRADLHDLLDEASSRQLVVVSAPPGTGKSTLVASYIESRNLPSLWYQVDKGDDDLAYFLYCLGIATLNLNPHEKSLKLLLTPKIFEGTAAFARRFFRELYRHLEIPFLIVFDNYQDVAEDAPLHEIIEVACTDLPKGGRIVIISRNKCPAAMARLLASNKVAIIGRDELELAPSDDIKAIDSLPELRLPSTELSKH